MLLTALIRQTERVEMAAAQLNDRQAGWAVSSALEANGVRWAWQLSLADPEDWARFGASTGLKLAVKQELLRPTAEPAASKAKDPEKHGMYLVNC